MKKSIESFLNVNIHVHSLSNLIYPNAFVFYLPLEATLRPLQPFFFNMVAFKEQLQKKMLQFFFFFRPQFSLLPS